MKSVFSLFFFIMTVSSALPQALPGKSSKKAPAALVQEVSDLYNARVYEKYKEGVVKLEQALQSYPKDADVMAYLSLFYSQLTYRDWHFGRKDTTYLDEAEKLGRQATIIDKKNVNAYKGYGSALLILGKRSEAEGQLKVATTLAPNDAEAWYLYACASKGSLADESSEAGSRLKKSLEADKSFIWALQDLIMTNLKKKNLAQAESWLARLKEAHSAHADTPYYEGLVQLHQDKEKEARASFEEYVKRNKAANLREFVRLYLSK